MGCRRRWVLRLGLGLAVWLLGASPALALWGDSQGAFGLDGSLRSIAAMLDNRSLGALSGGHDVDTYSQSILRLTAAGKPSSRLAYEAHLVTSYTYTSVVGGSETSFSLAGGHSRYRALDTAWNWKDDTGQSGLLWWDRLNAKFSLAKVDITLGRQAITFGKAYFFNPLDVFLPFDPRQFDREYKAGVDALRVDIYLGDFSGITLVAAAGRELDVNGQYLDDHTRLDASWYGSALLARAYTTLAGWDLAVQGGKVYGAYQLGGALTGDLGPLQVRAEAAYFWADGRRPLPAPLKGDIIEDHLMLVLGAGHRFDNSLTLEAEYLFNGAGDPDNLEAALARVNCGAALQMGRHLLGATVSYEITPLVVGQLAVLCSLSDGSCLLQPTLTISVADNVSMLVGASLGLGEGPEGDDPDLARIRSEFGSYPRYFFAELKFYF